MKKQEIMNRIMENAKADMMSDAINVCEGNEEEAKELAKEWANDENEMKHFFIRAMQKAIHLTKNSNLNEETKKAIIKVIQESEEYKAFENGILKMFADALVRYEMIKAQ